jgi:hypothetical protein
MDEEDGRPGPRARQFGPFDVPMDVLVRSLRRSRLIPEQASPHRRVAIANIYSRQSFPAIQPTSNPAPRHGRGPAKAFAWQQVEEHHENVPGK